MKISINLLNIKSLEEAKKKIESYKRKLIDFAIYEYLEYSAKEIEKLANKKLDQSINQNYEITTNIRDSWTHTILKENNNWKCVIVNTCDESAYVEFGTGIVGSYDEHPAAKHSNYEYDINRNGFIGWTFYNKEANLFLRNFAGYTGKRFLYLAYNEYFESKQSRIVWNNILKKYKID